MIIIYNITTIIIKLKNLNNQNTLASSCLRPFMSGLVPECQECQSANRMKLGKQEQDSQEWFLYFGYYKVMLFNRVG
ncbi:MAG: hypothetical protein IJE45_01475 [Bacilli bacterium]|nr:hypothetical protein [Bacilli bacterium]